MVDVFGEDGVDEATLERRAEERNPALHNGRLYYTGNVEQAIAECRARNGFLIVFLKGGDKESYLADETLHVTLGWKPVNCVALRLHDDLSNVNPKAFKKAKAFREIFPAVERLPYLKLLAPDGTPLASLQGEDVAKRAAGAIEEASVRYPLQQDTAPSAQQANDRQNASANDSGGLGPADMEGLAQALLLVSHQAAGNLAAAASGGLTPQPSGSQSLGERAASLTSIPSSSVAEKAKETVGIQSGAGRNAEPRASSEQSTGAELAQASQPESAAARVPVAEPSVPSPALPEAQGLESEADTGGRGGGAAVIGGSSTAGASASAKEQQEVAPTAAWRGASSQPAGSEAPSPPTSASLAIRLLDGSFLREDFPAKATLADVLAYIDKHRTDGSRPYLLRTSFPRRSLTAALGLATLESLDLCPRSLLVLQPAGGLTSSPVSAAPGVGAGLSLLALLWSWVTATVTAIVTFFSGAMGRQHASSRSGQPDAASGKGSSLRSRPGAAGLARRTPVDQSKDEGNTYYKGNTTEFKGED